MASQSRADVQVVWDALLCIIRAPGLSSPQVSRNLEIPRSQASRNLSSQRGRGDVWSSHEWEVSMLKPGSWKFLQ